MNKTGIIFLLSCIYLTSNAQISKEDRKEEKRERVNAMIKQEEEGIISYHRQTDFGIKLLSDGYGIFMDIGRAKSVKKAWLYQLEIDERKSRKEIKQTNPQFSNVPYVYGKENFVYNVKLGAQFQYLLANKANKNGVSISANGGGGLMFGILRPYFVQLISNGQYVKYQSSDSASFLDNNQIAGGPDLSQGWNDLSLNPGLYAKAALRFDYGKFNEMVRAIEVGVNLDAYSKKLLQMVYVKPKQLFTNVYVCIIFGKRK